MIKIHLLSKDELKCSSESFSLKVIILTHFFGAFIRYFKMRSLLVTLFDDADAVYTPNSIWKNHKSPKIKPK